MKRLASLLVLALLTAPLAGAQPGDIEEENLDETEATAEEAPAGDELAPPELVLPERVETAPTSPLTELESLAEQKYLDGDLEVASQLYQQLAELVPKDDEKIRFLVLAAWLEHQLEKEWRAQALLTQALVIDIAFPFQAENYSQPFVDLYVASREAAAAERQAKANDLVHRALAAIRGDDLATARRLLDEALDVVPDDPFALYNRALVDQRQGLDEEATTGYERLQALERSNPGLMTPELKSRTTFNLAMLYFDRGYMEDAEAHLESAVALDPGNASAWNTLGLARHRLGQTEGAVAAFREALRLEPSHVPAANSLATVYLEREQWMEAVALLIDATKRVDDDPGLWLNLAIGQQGMQNREGALASLERVTALDADNTRGTAFTAAAMAANLLYRLDRPVDAIEAAQRALGWDPDHLESLIYLGLAQQKIGDQAAALAALERAVQLAPERADLHNNLGSTLVLLRDHRRAAEEFRRALELQPDFPEATANLRQVEQYLDRQTYAAAQPGQIREKKPARQLRPLGATLSDEDLTRLGLHGVRVDHVQVGSAAHRAGIRAGDLILRVDGYKVAKPSELVSYLYEKAPSPMVAVDLLRDGRAMAVKLDLR